MRKYLHVCVRKDMYVCVCVYVCRDMWVCACVCVCVHDIVLSTVQVLFLAVSPG